ncbi:MAG: efflux RND transporter periplasmic adaptor subunit [Armatimonadetes bacterium]|nr:efflux RND transporter periplasmic adaptor subunit [Armatimonadota bacterium]
MLAKRLLPIVVAASVAVFLASCGRPGPGPRESQPTETVIPVRTIEAHVGTIEQSFTMDGTVKAENEVGVYAKVPGKLIRVYYDEGDWVPKGALVAELDRDEIVAQVNQARAAVKAAQARVAQAREGHTLQRASTSTGVEQAEAALAAARARLAQAQTGTELTDKDVQTSVAAAEEAVRMAEARLDALKAGARRQERRIAQERVSQAKANMETAKANLERARKLLAAQAIAQQQFDAYKLQYDVAVAEYQAAVQQADLTEEGPREEEIRAAEAQVAQARAQLEKAKALALQVEMHRRDIEAAREQVRQAEAAVKLARASRIRDTMAAIDIKSAQAMLEQAQANLRYAEAQLRNTYIYAPAAGYVFVRNLDPGEIASPSVPILSLVDNRQVKVVCPLSEERARFVRIGQEVTLTVDALPGRVFRGVVKTISPAASPQSRSFEVQIRVPNPRGELKAGMFARVTVVTQRQRSVLVPYDAVVNPTTKPAVFVVAGGVARERAVKLGVRQNATVAIVHGVSPGEQVVVSGQTELRDGAKVSVEPYRGDEQ